MARVVSGAGILAVGIQSVPKAAADSVARTMHARGGPGEDSGRLESWPGLEARVREHRALLGARWEDVRRSAVPVNPRAPTRVSVNLEAGRCLDVLVTPSDEVASLDVLVEDSTGRIVARGREHARDRAAVVCSAIPVELTVAIRPRASQGLVAVVIGRSAAGSEPELAGAVASYRITQTLELADARREHGRAFAGRGYDAAKTIVTGAAKVGSRASFPLDLPPGCVRVDVIAGKPLVDMQAELWDEHGTLAAETRGSIAAPLFVCGKGGPARVDVEALSQPGPFAVELRRDHTSPPALVAHPIAASRLLGRLNAGGPVADASAAAAAQVVPLDGATLRTLPLAVAVNSCAEVIAAADFGGAGLDLRLIDGASNEGVVTRGEHVASDRLCAGKTPKAGRVELRLISGKADALLLTHTLPGP